MKKILPMRGTPALQRATQLVKSGAVRPPDWYTIISKNPPIPVLDAGRKTQHRQEPMDRVIQMIAHYRPDLATIPVDPTGSKGVHIVHRIAAKVMERMLTNSEKANKAFRKVEEEMRDDIVLAIRRDFEEVLGPLRRDLPFSEAVKYELAKQDEITIRRTLAKKQGLRLLSPQEYLSVISQREAAKDGVADGKGKVPDGSDEEEEDPAFWNTGFKESYDRLLRDQKRRALEEGSRYLGLGTQDSLFARDKEGGHPKRGGLLGLLPDSSAAGR
eukprot:jgi/Mesvir1/22771/Mv14163-RA.1